MTANPSLIKKLSQAAMNGDCEAISAFLEEHGNECIDAFDNLRYTALVWAAQRNQLEAAELLLNNGASIDHRAGALGFGTALMYAAAEGHEKMVKLLLSRGADAEARNTQFGDTAADWAREKGHFALGQLLDEWPEKQRRKEQYQTESAAHDAWLKATDTKRGLEKPAPAPRLISISVTNGPLR